MNNNNLFHVIVDFVVKLWTCQPIEVKESVFIDTYLSKAISVWACKWIYQIFTEDECVINNW